MGNRASDMEKLHYLIKAVAESALEASVHEKDSIVNYAHYIKSKLFFDDPDFETRSNRGYEILTDEISKLNKNDS